MTQSMDARPRAANRGAAPSRNAAEVAQARIFEGILRAEISRLEELARSLPDRGLRRQRMPGGKPPEELVQLRARINEANRLLETLRRRFLHPRRPDGPGGGCTTSRR
ncbi:hypothetical protein [Mycobacterium xenopi]|uniref:Uncharacterized protein n=2 Tax=Mycobacterium xenopi TaxID=1789 RepID=A0AAD1H182_MYCXE|nr:hypothetical protein [Mycobacterium xenopi]EUA44527.1 hypothetical protein I552_4300 [Mycobacterium xenopi 3993]MDA3640296.1 hypothetical protein [Mycobacterium xenopi]MDA3658459.1 hypothetical protein [Mycobacterium xenopi]MDA3662584.1 hypothetical protein [Mycobacterium xenopi]SPX78472.1 Uncharacterised protein [Mycobacterium xenopi]